MRNHPNLRLAFSLTSKVASEDISDFFTVNLCDLSDNDFVLLKVATKLVAVVSEELVPGALNLLCLNTSHKAHEPRFIYKDNGLFWPYESGGGCAGRG